MNRTGNLLIVRSDIYLYCPRIHSCVRLGGRRMRAANGQKRKNGDGWTEIELKSPWLKLNSTRGTVVAINVCSRVASENLSISDDTLHDNNPVSSGTVDKAWAWAFVVVTRVGHTGTKTSVSVPSSTCIFIMNASRPP